MIRASRAPRRQRTEVQAARRIYLWAFFTRALAGLVAYMLTEYGAILLLEDALYYEEVGYSLASDWLSGRSSGGLVTLAHGGRHAWLMIAVIAIFYYLMQGIRALPLLLVFYSAITAWAPVYTYRITRELGAPEVAARRAAWLVALSPAFVFWSGALYKEGLTLLILNLAAYQTLRLQSRWQARSLISLVLSVLALFALRYYLAIIVSVAVVLGLLWGRRIQVPRVRIQVAAPVFMRQAVIALVFVGLMVTLGFTERAERRLAETREGVLVQLDVGRQSLVTSARSGYLAQTDISTPSEALRFFPVGLLYFLTVPLPWQLGRLRQNLVIPETAFWILLYPLVVVGIRQGLRVNWQGTMFLLAITGGMCSIYALVSGNIGVAYRMRSQVWLLWAPFAAWGWEVWRQRRHSQKAGHGYKQVAEEPMGQKDKEARELLSVRHVWHSRHRRS